MFDRLRLKITFGTAFILGGFLLLLGMYIINSQKVQLVQNLNDHGSRVAALAARSSAEYIQRFSFFLMEDQALSIEQSPNIAFCEIYDSKGVSLLQSGNIISIDHTGKNRAVYGDNILVVTQPIVSESNMLGMVEIGLRLDGVNKAIQDKTNHLIVLFSVFTLCVIITLNLFFQRLFIKPILSLADGTQRVANREFVSIDVGPRRDEIGVLAHQFNAMSENLQGLYKNLEGKVQERTQALEQANTDLVVAIEQAQAMAAKAEAGTVAKSQFLASMSHEIRTPMNAVLGIGELLGESRLNEEQRLLVNTLLKSGNALLSLIDDILDLSKIEAGEMVFEDAPFNLDAVIDKAFKVTAYAGHQKKLDLDYMISPDVPQELLGDPLRLQQILINLIGNGIKFTDKGSVLLVVSLESGWGAVVDEAVVVRFSVVDTGVGIRPSKLETIFDKFTQADASTTRRYGGTGLGLSICKLLCENLGGSIGIESEYGAGTSVSFSLSYKVYGTGPKVLPGLDGISVAVIDSREYASKTVVSRLEQAGATVDLQSRPEDLAREAVGQYAVIVVNTPTLNSKWEGSRAWIDAFGIEPKKLILLTPNESGNRTFAKTFMKTLNKPVHIPEIAEFLADEHISLSARESASGGQSFTQNGLRILLVEDSENNSMLMEFYLKGLNHRLDIAKDGEEGLALYKREPFDIVFMDVEMPVMDGIECTRQLREWEKKNGKAPVRIVALTAHALNEIKSKITVAGGDAFLTKPIAKRDFLMVVEKHEATLRKKALAG